MEGKPWPMDSTSTATKLLEKRRMMYEVKEEFDQAKEEERERDAEFKEKESYLRAKDLSLQQGLIQFNQVLQENDLKRNKAKKKYEEELRQKRQKEERIEQLNHDIEELSFRATSLEKEVTKMRKYEDFLERVREKNPDDFTDISDILARYNTLKQSYEDLMKKRHQLEEELQDIKWTRDLYEKEKKDQLMELAIDIANTQKSIEDLDIIRSDLQKEVDTVSSTATEKDLELGCMLTAIENLYQRCKTEEPGIHHDRTTKVKETQNLNDYNYRAKTAVSKLNAIKAYIKDIEDILADERSVELLKESTHSSIDKGGATKTEA
ncbi:unnamed protein product [Blepharisma stoltei]|uniref:DUF4200 domain-containing protein n=1 Tax=Blepharisma stoltei TaxID=1481888 RepID=A0AAU9KKQ6_9CILI|nr:unnamed protein product [Blepharisma stoltei]